MLDGMSNSNPLETGGVIGQESIGNIQGNTQKFFIDSWLIDEVTVYDSNIPVQYGGFTGGVVDVTTKKPGSKFGGKLSYRTTQSGWSHYFIDERDREVFNKSESSESQPNFRKDFYSVSLNIPVTEDTKFITSYSRRESVIPLGYFDGYRDTERRSESYYLKGLHNIDGVSYIEASFTYSPYKGKYFVKDTIESDYETVGGGYFASANYFKETGEGGNIKFHADYSFQENSRINSTDYHKTWISSYYKPWGSKADLYDELPSYEGGPGNLNKENGALNLSFDQNLSPRSLWGKHKISYGATYGYIMGRHHRPEEYTLYSGAVLSEDVICIDTETCVDGEQYFTIRSTYPKSDVRAYINQFAAYANEEWRFNRFLFNAGLRVTNDDYMNNTDFSPRTRLQADIFNDNGTILAAGYARYYGSSLLSNKLREGILPSIKNVRWTDKNLVQSWEYTDNQSFTEYNFSDLRTPYSDEFTAGVEQKIFGSILNLNYTARLSEDEFARDYIVLEKDGRRHWRLNNNGSSQYQSVQLKWSKSWKNHSLLFNTTWSESKTSNDNYDSDFSLEDMETEVFLEGKRIKLKDLPRDNFNKPYVLNFAYAGKFFENLTVSAILKYTTPYKKLTSDDDVFVGYGETNPDTGERDEITLASYSIAHINEQYMLDCVFSWKQKTYKDQSLTVTLEIFNILDLKNKIGEGSRSTAAQGYYTYDIYQMGRQFWLGLAYAF
ncbi:MAG: hypothetical protein LBD73_04995 [Deferribacteraceae bacterium]|jgi:hypothetical protein|nr:hypothetical protein [Deferribacteraceae bacterium]